MPPFILEIGSEEIPARFLAETERYTTARLSTLLQEEGIEFSGLCCCSTPRRLTLYIESLAESSVTKEEVVMGPPIKAAYDVGGRPTRAAEGFAKTHGVSLEETYTQTTEKGTYLAVRKTIGGGATFDFLVARCPELIASIPFPKKMRWGNGEFTYARPLRWILAMFGDRVVPFTIGGKASDAQTYGHRVHGPGPLTVTHASEYFSVVRKQGSVVVDSSERRRTIVEVGNALAQEKSATVLWKDSLLDEVQGLCEYPVPILGKFDPSFLEVPREVLLTSMESHQKSFGVESVDGRLSPYFLTVLNLQPDDIELVRAGWERVLRARLEDARFFWKTDRAASFAQWLEALDSVIFLAPLGSMGDKTRRISELCGWLTDSVVYSLPIQPVSKEDAMRAGRLSKADLVSEMVKEFDTLQGVMGGIYAGHAGESATVTAGIAEQYLPAGPDSPVPPSLCGALVSLADKADTLVGCFGLGMIPTGAADPYALRRAMLGIIRIIQEKGMRIDLRELFCKALDNYGDIAWKLEPEQCLVRLHEFFVQRLKNMYLNLGYETLITEACLSAGVSDIWSTTLRIEALSEQSKTPEYEPSVLTFKRLANIIKKQSQESGEVLTGQYDPTLFTDEAEKQLAAAFEAQTPIFEKLWVEENFSALFALTLELRPVVDTFFDTVMVICDDVSTRRNRLNLLQALVNRLARLADFAALQI